MPYRASVMNPFGERDWNDGYRKSYMDELYPALDDHGWSIGVQLMGGSLAWSGIEKCCEWIKEKGGSVVWHAPDSWPLRMGFRDFNLSEFLIKFEPAAPLIEAGLLDAVNIHLGVMRWIDDKPEDCTDLDARYNAWYGADEMLKQLYWHEEHLKLLVKLLGKNHLLIENTSSWCSLPDCHYLAGQIGAGHTAFNLAKRLGVEVTLDPGHYIEDWQGCHREGPFEGFIKPSLATLTMEEAEVLERTGLVVRKDYMPYMPATIDIDAVIMEVEPLLLHADGARGVFMHELDGPIDAHLPIVTKADATRSGVTEFIASTLDFPEDVLGIVVEVCGKKYWNEAGYACTDRIADDQEAKRRTFETIVDCVVKGTPIV